MYCNLCIPRWYSNEFPFRSDWMGFRYRATVKWSGSMFGADVIERKQISLSAIDTCVRLRCVYLRIWKMNRTHLVTWFDSSKFLSEKPGDSCDFIDWYWWILNTQRIWIIMHTDFFTQVSYDDDKKMASINMRMNQCSKRDQLLTYHQFVVFRLQTQHMYVLIERGKTEKKTSKIEREREGRVTER